jgi:signal transduction histidine kinase
MQNNRFDVIRDELPRAIQESLEGVARVVSIVRAMREVSHPGRDEFVDIDLNSAIESSVTITRNRWKYSAEVACDLDPELSCLRGNAGNINQLIVNLIVNAADATAEKFGENPEQRGTITVRTVQEREHAVIQVEDNGCGIPEDIQERIFDPFFTTKDVGKGTGQGLALAYNIVVKRHQGTIEVDSTPGVGAIFTVRLPWERDVQTEVADKVASVAINAPVVLTS